MHVPAQHAVHPHAGVLAENNVANDLRRIIDEARTRDGRGYAFIGTDHEAALSTQRVPSNERRAVSNPAPLRLGSLTARSSQLDAHALNPNKFPIAGRAPQFSPHVTDSRSSS